MMEALLVLLLIGFIAYVILKKVNEKSAQEAVRQETKEKAERTSQLIDALASRVYDEIKEYGEKHGASLDHIARISVSQFSAFVIWKGKDVSAQRIDYETLGYKIDDDEEPFGEKTCRLQKAVVSLLGSEWVVVSDKKLESYTHDSEVVVKGKDDGSVEISHPKEFYYRIESEIISKADYEARLKKASRVTTRI